MGQQDNGINHRLDRYEERMHMLDHQLKRRGIKNKGVLQSMLAVPRHQFVPELYNNYAYYDGPLQIGEGQTISQPYIVALMVEAIEPESGDRVLEIGTGSGYAAAVIARIVSMVYTVERHEALARQAQSRFVELKYGNIKVRVADGTKGWPEKAPFDSILVSAGAPGIPQSLIDQLKPGGRLVIPAGTRGCQDLLRIRKHQDGSILKENLGAVCFVPLIGEEGWDEQRR